MHGFFNTWTLECRALRAAIPIDRVIRTCPYIDKCSKWKEHCEKWIRDTDTKRSSTTKRSLWYPLQNTDPCFRDPFLSVYNLELTPHPIEQNKHLVVCLPAVEIKSRRGNRAQQLKVFPSSPTEQDSESYRERDGSIGRERDRIPFILNESWLERKMVSAILKALCERSEYWNAIFNANSEWQN